MNQRVACFWGWVGDGAFYDGVNCHFKSPLAQAQTKPSHEQKMKQGCQRQLLAGRF